MKIAIITPYPDQKNVHAKNTGVGSYSYYLYSSIAKDTELTIWAQKGESLQNDIDNSHSNKITTERIWNKGFTGIFSLAIKSIREKVDVIHIQHEFNMFGDELSLLFTPLIAIVPRLMGVKVVTTFHGGMGLREIDKDFVKENGKKLPPFIIRLAFRYIFGLFSLASNKIIVHEEFQKKQLVEEHFVDADKIYIIPHGVPDNPEFIQQAKEKLQIEDKKVMLYMGFAAKYKGLPELFEIYKNYIQKPENKNTVLIIGAGMAPRLEEDAEYKKWYLDLKAKYQSLGDFVRWVGFIPGAEIADYYSASDSVLFPYTRRLAASGPMAIAIGYEKDIILSNVLKGETNEIKNYTFDLNDVIKTSDLKKGRVWERVAEKTLELYLK